MFNRLDVLHITTTVWVVGALIIANINLLDDNIIGWLLWMIFAMVVIIIENVEIRKEIRRIKGRIKLLKKQIEIEKAEEKLLKKQIEIEEEKEKLLDKQIEIEKEKEKFSKNKKESEKRKRKNG